MRKILFIFVILSFIAVPFLTYAQTEKELEQAKSWLGQWKRNFASPSYGITLFHGKLDGGWYGQPEAMAIPDSDRDFPTTAMDFRIFRGVNVSKRGGFYTGVETGVLFLKPFKEISWYEPVLGENMYLDYTGGLVFLMAKYGLRLDLGISLFGVSFGAEMGMGGTLFAGGLDFYTGSKDNKTADVGWGTSTANMSLVLDTALEAAIRLGKNFRLFGKAGIMIAPISVPRNDERDQYNVWYDGSTLHVNYSWDTGYTDPSTNTYVPPTELTGDERTRAIMSQYNINIDPFALDLRFGFILNFQ